MLQFDHGFFDSDNDGFIVYLYQRGGSGGLGLVNKLGFILAQRGQGWQPSKMEAYSW
jgi:hypothetical protein